MDSQRVKTREPDGTETTVHLEKLFPLDGHGGRLRQRFRVTGEDGRRVGTITRHRTDLGNVTHWTATGLDLRTEDHHSRGAAIFALLNRR